VDDVLEEICTLKGDSIFVTSIAVIGEVLNCVRCLASRELKERLFVTCRFDGQVWYHVFACLGVIGASIGFSYFVGELLFLPR